MKNINKYSIKRFLLSVLLSITLISFDSCTKVEELDMPVSEVGKVGEMVDCSLNLSVEDMTITAGDITKAGDISYVATAEECAINNIVVLQYNTTGKLVGVPLYYGDLDSDKTNSDEHEFTSVPMLDSKNDDEDAYEKHTVVLIANSFLSDIETNSQLRENISSLDLLKNFLYAYDSEDEENHTLSCMRKGDDNKEYFTMSSMNETEVKSGTDIEAKLQRNVAKIVVTVNNTSGELTDATIKLGDMPSLTPYFTNYDKQGTYPTLYGYTEIESNEQIIVEGTKEYIFYMPANVRGAIDEKDVKDENIPLFAKLNSTFIKITKELGSDDGTPSTKSLECKIYLIDRKEDGSINFDVKENHQYNYTITATDVNEESANYDSRITVNDQAKIDYTTQRASNCYILNPNSNCDVEYYIPIFERINEFWGDQGYENVPENLINPLKGDQFSVELAWHDFNLDTAYNEQSFEDIKDIITFSNGAETSPSGVQSLKVTLKKESVDKEGNVLVKIVKDGNVVWSWHFWITSYNPNSVATYKNKYVSKVENGEIRRYGGDFWRENLAGKYIMDRYIGSSSSSGNYCMYYQWGRKDPFVVNPSYKETEKDDGTTTTTTTRTFQADQESCLVTVKDWVYNPTTFYEKYQILTTTQLVATTQPFPYDMLYNFGYKLWNDPKLNDIDDYEHSRKSIFDPSPLGWRIPDYDTFENLTAVNTKIVKNTKEDPGVEGWYARLYNPSATDNSQVSRENSIATFAGTGYISYLGNPTSLSYNTAVYMWTNFTPTTSTTSRHYYLISLSTETIQYSSMEIQNGGVIIPIME